MSDLRGVRAVVFDAYGTPLDLDGSLSPELAERGASGRALLGLWRRKQLEDCWSRGPVAAACRRSRGRDGRRARPCDGGRRHGRPGVARAAPRGLRRAPGLSAGARGAAAAARRRARHRGPGGRLAGPVEPVLSVETVGIGRPAPAVDAVDRDRPRRPAERIALFASNGWDQAGAACFGLRVVAVRRADAVPDRLPGDPVAGVRDLAELPARLGV